MCKWLLIFLIASVTADQLIITLPDGKIRGHEVTTSENISFYAFQGIPFASPPLGKLRFQAPISPEPWTGIKNATESGNSCIAIIHFPGEVPQVESEDCLYLNVYTPARNITKKLPVMFWIYGGAYLAGTSSYDTYGPDYLVHEDVIVVTSNYRLGMFGFLATGDKVVLGNSGLKDQLLALKWTKKNIGLFGGDPEKITIFGESAGGESIGVHIVNKKSKGLFRAAICQSGCSLMIMNATFGAKATYDLAKIIDDSISYKNTTKEVIDFLQSQSADVILKANQQLGITPNYVIEPEDKDAFVTELSYPLLESGDINRVPLMIGTTSQESLTFLPTFDAINQTAASFDLNKILQIPQTLIPKEGADLNHIANSIKYTYIGFHKQWTDHLVQFLEYFSDNLFLRSSLRQVELQSSYTPVYFYQFSYYGTMSKIMNHTIFPGSGRVGHAEELPYLFKISSYPPPTDDDLRVRQRLARLWSNFAKTLNPTPNHSDPLLKITWPTSTPCNIKYLDIDQELKVRPNRKIREMIFWNHLYDTYGKKPFIGY